MAEKYQQQRKSIIAVENVSKEDALKYGIAKTSKIDDSSLFKINSIIEKPAPERTPSTLDVVVRYVLSSEISYCL